MCDQTKKILDLLIHMTIQLFLPYSNVRSLRVNFFLRAIFVLFSLKLHVIADLLEQEYTDDLQDVYIEPPDILMKILLMKIPEVCY